MPPAKKSTSKAPAKATGKTISSPVIDPVTMAASVVDPGPSLDPIMGPAIMQVIEPANPLVEGGERKVHYDETDVAFALSRHTEDGRGEQDPGPSDFKGFPAEGVIKEE